MTDDEKVELSLPLETAEALHAALEDLLGEGGRPDRRGNEDAVLKRAYRILTWRILAVKGGAGLTGRMSELARNAGSVEEYEAARDEALGPILDGLENAENRDP
ncbi:MAG TPA: hypothetical protein VK357_01165 [Rubrobacteraceae bacterium]|nr:hypothetical protein [Rubrobacteraceae bacterium]